MEESLAFALIAGVAASSAVGFSLLVSVAWKLYSGYSCRLRKPSCSCCLSVPRPERAGTKAASRWSWLEACSESCTALRCRLIRPCRRGYVEGRDPPPKILLPWEDLPPAARAVPTYWKHQDLLPLFPEEAALEGGGGEACPGGGGGVRLAEVSAEDHEALQALLNAGSSSGSRGPSMLQSFIRRRSAAPAFLRLSAAKRVENAALWRSFAVERHAVVQKWQNFAAVQRLKLAAGLEPPGGAELRGDANEVYMWYSCGGQAEVDGIIENGFMPAVGASSRFLFACSGSEADAALPKAQSGLYCLLLCRVVLGKIDWAARRRLVGSGAAAARAVRGGGCDSSAYGGGGGRWMAVYRRAVAYPEYVVFYHRSFEPSIADALRV